MRSVVFAFVMLLASASYAAGPAKVLLLPFESVGPADKQWVAKAVQQNLLAELSRLNSVQPVTGTQPAKDSDAAIKAAGDAGAEYVVFGSYQAVEGDLRITGQVMDVSKKQPVAGLKSTGSVRDLFGMEDVIANQVKRALPQPVAVAGPEMLKQPPAVAPAPAPAPAEADRPPVNLNQKARELEEQIDRAIERIRYSADYGADYYPNGYFYSGIYSPYYYYPAYSYPILNRRCFYGGSGLSVSGGFSGRNFSGSFNVGAGRNFVTSPTANYANFGRMSVQSTRR